MDWPWGKTAHIVLIQYGTCWFKLIVLFYEDKQRSEEGVNKVSVWIENCESWFTIFFSISYEWKYLYVSNKALWTCTHHPQRRNQSYPYHLCRGGRTHLDQFFHHNEEMQTWVFSICWKGRTVLIYQGVFVPEVLLFSLAHMSVMLLDAVCQRICRTHKLLSLIVSLRYLEELGGAGDCVCVFDWTTCWSTSTVLLIYYKSSLY